MIFKRALHFSPRLAAVVLSSAPKPLKATSASSPVKTAKVAAAKVSSKSVSTSKTASPRLSEPAKESSEKKTETTATPESKPQEPAATGFVEQNLHQGILDGQTNWSTSFQGIGSARFAKDAETLLTSPLEADEIEITPDGLLFLPEIKYRRILNKAFGPGAWGLVPRGETSVLPKLVTREYGLVVLGRLVSVARGEQTYFDPSGIPTATEGCKSNAMMRCCKDLGIASELWDPRFIRKFKSTYCEEKFVEHAVTKRKRKLWKRKNAEFEYPYKG